MLIHIPIGPFDNGRYAVAYLTPGCSVFTPVCNGLTQSAAHAESSRLNAIQINNEINRIVDENVLHGKKR